MLFLRQCGSGRMIVECEYTKSCLLSFSSFITFRRELENESCSCRLKRRKHVRVVGCLVELLPFSVLRCVTNSLSVHPLTSYPTPESPCFIVRSTCEVIQLTLSKS